MRWLHDDFPERSIALAYCLNLHAGEDLDATLAGMRSITLPLKERLSPERPFGVGMYLPGNVAAQLADPANPTQLAGLRAFLSEHDLDPFTFNAFPHGGFHSAGLKADVYKPTWLDDERVRFTIDVARIAAALHTAPAAASGPARHVSISSHPGAFGAWIEDADELRVCARNMARVVATLASIEEEGGPHIILSLEAEPRASSGDSRALAAFLAMAHEQGAEVVRDLLGVSHGAALELVRRHLGVCLDCCHAAVEFEEPHAALAYATRSTLGKIQFSSALALQRPGAAHDARAALLAMNEPRYLHQVTGRRAGSDTAELLRVDDLPALASALDDPESPWLAADEWRCHFHVPVDLAALEAGVGTTQAHADELLRQALSDPAAWTTPELQLEIETYTWDILPGAARGAGELVDGLAREYDHVMQILSERGWRKA